MAATQFLYVISASEYSLNASATDLAKSLSESPVQPACSPVFWQARAPCFSGRCTWRREAFPGRFRPGRRQRHSALCGRATHRPGTGSSATICGWWRILPRTVDAEGKKSRKASGDAALRDLLWDKAKGKMIWRGSGQARFGDYNRHVVVFWTAFI